MHIAWPQINGFKSLRVGYMGCIRWVGQTYYTLHPLLMVVISLFTLRCVFTIRATSTTIEIMLLYSNSLCTYCMLITTCCDSASNKKGYSHKYSFLIPSLCVISSWKERIVLNVEKLVCVSACYLCWKECVLSHIQQLVCVLKKFIWWDPERCYHLVL